MSTRNLNRSEKKAILRGVDARAYKFKGAAGRRSSRAAKRAASKAARHARKAEAAWLSDDESVS